MNEVFAKMVDGNQHFILKGCLVLGQVEAKQYIRGYKLSPRADAKPNAENQENPREQKEDLDEGEQEEQEQENKIEIYNKLQIIHYK